MARLFICLLALFTCLFIYLLFCYDWPMCCFGPERATFPPIWYCSGNRVESPALASVFFCQISVVCVYVGTYLRKHAKNVFGSCICNSCVHNWQYICHIPRSVLTKGQNNLCSSDGAAVRTLGLFYHFSALLYPAPACFSQLVSLIVVDGSVRFLTIIKLICLSFTPVLWISPPFGHPFEEILDSDFCI